MKPSELLDDVRRLGVDPELFEDGRRFRPVGHLQNLPDELVSALRRERLWLLMLLQCEARTDAVDPRLAFLASADDGITKSAIRTRMFT